MAGQTKTLTELGLTAHGARQAQISGLAVDNRLVQDGTLFFALPGSKTHGARFIPAALEAGAAAVLTDADD